ncbi:MAG: OmpH family outer membrane protein [Sphingobacteriales bacterium]|nr:MAG: OmpH family outer membrane protein [Sphingobacteriales bacterium]
MKKQFLYLFVALMCLGYAVQGQVGFVSRAVIYQSIPGFVKDLKSIDSMQAVYTKEMQLQGEQLQQKASSLMAAYSPKANETLEMIKKRMSPADTMALKKVFDDNIALENKGKGYDAKIVRSQKEKVEPILAKVDAAIKKMAIAENLDAVYFFEDISTGLAYINEKRNYTEQVIQLLK